MCYTRTVVPTVPRLGGLRVVVYPNDHRPAHMHVVGGGCEVVFHLNCPRGPVELRENYGFGKRALRQVRRKLADHLHELCKAWESIHGTD